MATIIVNLSGPNAGQVELQDAHYSQFSPLVINNDTGDVLIPQFCGLRITQAVAFAWYNNNQVVQSLPNYEDFYQHLINLDGGSLNGYHYSEYYVGGIWFTGPIGKCESENEPWFFPTPLTYDNPNPTLNGMADQLVIQTYGTIEFLDYNVSLPEPLEDPFGELPEPGDFCETWPDLCEEEDPVEIICEAWPELCGEGGNGGNGGGGDSINSFLGGAPSFTLDTPTGPPILPLFQILPIQQQLLGMTYFYQPTFEQFKTLKGLIKQGEGKTGSSSANKMIRDQVKEIESNLNNLLGLAKVGQNHLRMAFQQRQTFKKRYSNRSYSALNTSLNCSQKVIHQFLQFYLNFQQAKKSLRTIQGVRRLELLEHDLQMLNDLMKQANLEIAYLQNIIWPLENGEQLFKRKMNPMN